jgi:hypothetical protein
MFTLGHMRCLVVSLTALARVVAVLPWGWFEGT